MSYRFAILPIERIKPNPRNARTHSSKQIRQIVVSIKEFGFSAPILVDEHCMLIAGHGRFEAAKEAGLDQIPAVVLEGLSETKKRALMLADNRIAQNAGWDREVLSIELGELSQLLIDDNCRIDVTGFDVTEIDVILEDFGNSATMQCEEFDARALGGQAISRSGDVWQLGSHRVICGDCRDHNVLAELMSGDLADMAFTDPPYNVSIQDIVGRGNIKHQEFAMASGEMSRPQFVDFLGSSLLLARNFSREGSVHFVCMDWRHVEDLCAVGRKIYGAMLNLICWAKTNAGQGSFYRSQHELIGVFRVGEAQHRNEIQLGKHGRYRSNVWRYPGVNTFRKGRLHDLKVHPTVKPVTMVADAIKDCTGRGDIVLDVFVGAGTTILAAERVGRKARAVEISPNFVDATVRRWQLETGRDAIDLSSGQTFDRLGELRLDHKKAIPDRETPGQPEPQT